MEMFNGMNNLDFVKVNDVPWLNNNMWGLAENQEDMHYEDLVDLFGVSCVKRIQINLKEDFFFFSTDRLLRWNLALKKKGLCVFKINKSPSVFLPSFFFQFACLGSTSCDLFFACASSIGEIAAKNAATG